MYCRYICSVKFNYIHFIRKTKNILTISHFISHVILESLKKIDLSVLEGHSYVYFNIVKHLAPRITFYRYIFMACKYKLYEILYIDFR